MSNPKVSVVIPVCNVEQYLQECLDSALAQTLQDIEILCVDDGSKDSSPQILDEYARKDSRIKVIHKPNAGYGHTMNVGLDAATGEYLAILESDDIIKPNMYEVLYKLAKEHDLDLIKSDHEVFVGEPGNRDFTYKSILTNRAYYYRVLEPAREQKVFDAQMQTWSGLYRIRFLRENNIRHNETPGASYQDNGFWFQTFMHAKRAYFVDRAFYMLRRDNPNSSVRNRAKVFCIFEEYAFIEGLLRANPEKEKQLISMFQKKKCDNCRFHYSRVAPEFKMDFLRRMSDEFKEARAAGELDPGIFNESVFAELFQIMDQPEMYNMAHSEEAASEQTPQMRIAQLERELEYAKMQLAEIKASSAYKIGSGLTFLPRKLRRGLMCCREHGVMYTIRRAFRKLGIGK